MNCTISDPCLASLRWGGAYVMPVTATYTSPMGPEVVILLGWVVVGGGVGALIGLTKGRALVGLLLGLFFSIVGWIITALLPRTPAKQAEYQSQVAAAAARRAAPPA